jgi:uncharacterized protein
VAPPVVALAILTLLIPPARLWLGLGLAVSLVIAFVFAFVVPRRRYAVHRWEYTEHAIYTRSGWLWQQWRVVPLSRVQTVDSMRGPFEQMFNLAGITVTTASASGAIKIRGLATEVVEDLIEALAWATDRTPGDAT